MVTDKDLEIARQDLVKCGQPPMLVSGIRELAILSVSRRSDINNRKPNEQSESGIRELNSRLLLGKQMYYHCTNPANNGSIIPFEIVKLPAKMSRDPSASPARQDSLRMTRGVDCHVSYWDE